MSNAFVKGEKVVLNPDGVRSFPTWAKLVGTIVTKSRDPMMVTLRWGKRRGTVRLHMSYLQHADDLPNIGPTPGAPRTHGEMT